MNIFVGCPYSNPARDVNLYIYSLVKALDVVSGDSISWCFDRKVFWSEKILSCDLIFIHWPDHLLRESKKLTHTASELESRLIFLKEKGLGVIAACHNLEPHYCTDENIRRSYRAVYSNADVFIHLGESSLELFKKKYPEARQYLVPHHIYDNVNYSRPSSVQAMERLNLDKNKTYILCFGRFRSKSEYKMIKELGKKLPKDVEILAPSFVLVPPKMSWTRKLLRFVKTWILGWFIRGIHVGKGPVSNEVLPYYFSASKIVLIHHLSVLNSGIVPMAFYFAKPVVGPDMGNVSAILRGTGNQVYQTGDGCPLDAVQKALASDGLGDRNFEYAKANWASEKVARKLYDILLELYEDKQVHHKI